MPPPSDDNPFAPPTPSLGSETTVRVEENQFESVPLTATIDGVTSMPPDAGTVAARARALAKREARLARQEEDLARREEEAQNHTRDPASRAKNWPSFFPILRYDLEDFPPSNRPLMRVAHRVWCLSALAYAWNAFVITCALLTNVASTKTTDWLLSLVFFGAGVPLSRWGWYGALVAAARRASRGVLQTAAYGRFFVHFGVHFLAVTFAFVSVPVAGTFCAGFFFVVAAFADDTSGAAFVGVVGVASVALWGGVLCGSLWTGKQALERFRDA
jgi:hypothetical protein